MNDYVEIINNYILKTENKVILYGHSISTAIALYVAQKINRIDGIILINPSYRMKSSKGMTPSIGEYIKYACYMIFASHTPIVNMAGIPEEIDNYEEKIESQIRNKDPLLVKYISMYMMIESKKLLKNMKKYASKVDSHFYFFMEIMTVLVNNQDVKKYIMNRKNNKKIII